jgi:hypothetical protein
LGVATVPQLEDGQFRLGRLRVHNPVSWHAETLIGGLLPAQVDERCARRANLDHEQGRLGELRSADLAYPNHHEVRSELGPRPQLDGRLRQNTEIFRACTIEHPVQSACRELMDRCRPWAHDEHPVQQVVPAAVIGYPVQFGHRERLAAGRPRLGDCHNTHRAPFCPWRPL